MPESLRIVTFNMLHGGMTVFGGGDGHRLEERLALTIEGLRRLDPDVIGLQEASAGAARGDVAARVAAALGFEHVRASAGYRCIGRAAAWVTGFDEGPAILTRFRILGSEAIALASCDEWYGRQLVCDRPTNGADGLPLWPSDQYGVLAEVRLDDRP